MAVIFKLSLAIYTVSTNTIRLQQPLLLQPFLRQVQQVQIYACKKPTDKRTQTQTNKQVSKQASKHTSIKSHMQSNSHSQTKKQIIKQKKKKQAAKKQASKQANNQTNKKRARVQAGKHTNITNNHTHTKAEPNNFVAAVSVHSIQPLKTNVWMHCDVDHPSCSESTILVDFALS